jgi:hypothetical protein
VANTNQKLQDLGAAIQAQQESVNKAIVDVQTARDNAAAAQQKWTPARSGHGGQHAIAAAQQRFDTFAAATYVNGPSDSYLTASDPADILSTAAAGQTLAVSSQQSSPTLSAPHRAGEQGVGRAVGEAERRQGRRRRGSQPADAVSALTQAQQTFKSQQSELDQLTAERAAAQAKLDAPATGRRPRGGSRRRARRGAAAVPGANWDRAPGARDTVRRQVGFAVGSHDSRDPERIRQR